MSRLIDRGRSGAVLWPGDPPPIVKYPCKRERKSEDQEGSQLWKLVRLHEKALPALMLLTHVPNGGDRNAIVGAKLKAQGVRKGWPDYMLAVQTATSTGLALELKAVDGTVSDEQDKILRMLSAAGWRTVVAWGWEAAWDEIKRHAERAVWAPL